MTIFLDLPWFCRSKGAYLVVEPDFCSVVFFWLAKLRAMVLEVNDAYIATKVAFLLSNKWTPPYKQ